MKKPPAVTIAVMPVRPPSRMPLALSMNCVWARVVVVHVAVHNAVHVAVQIAVHIAVHSVTSTASQQALQAVRQGGSAGRWQRSAATARPAHTHHCQRRAAQQGADDNCRQAEPGVQGGNGARQRSARVMP
jgi:hypothetical protein